MIENAGNKYQIRKIDGEWRIQKDGLNAFFINDLSGLNPNPVLAFSSSDRSALVAALEQGLDEKGAIWEKDEKTAKEKYCKNLQFRCPWVKRKPSGEISIGSQDIQVAIMKTVNGNIIHLNESLEKGESSQYNAINAHVQAYLKDPENSLIARLLKEQDAAREEE